MFCKVDGDATAYWLLFRGNKILTIKDKVQLTLSDLELHKLSEKLVRRQYLGQVEGHSCYVAELSPDTVVSEAITLNNLRRLLGQIPEDLFFLAGKASQILHWDRTHQFCGQCGAHTENKIDELAKLCPSCGFVNYPRISPAIIVAITREREILLAKGSRFQAGFYSVLAGFVEPGETFEECVQREVREEVGLEVKNVNYFGSQPWPFPDSLMVGFTAEYASGDITIDNKEILDAGWFTVEQLPLIPGIGSIARSLIDWFVKHKG
ncbi:NADH pyrophosphatase [Desulfosporosinus sp. I2]|uniref:NAD(+) diphosphatase n=1 Tax=Desulfosporosinus sp. I2 TaxID=1617025 RepID=UPI0005EF63AA|nr:NAD(+) diphosphatase [Desulfosporosinus sp. I2]KJR48826.1 NADH pyrophosphatase [Desulfosporosinus sp. I2]